MAELRGVLDTNVIVSALLLPGSVPFRVFEAVLLKGTLLLSPQIMVEYRSTLDRPKFDRYVSAEKRQRFLIELEELSEWIEAGQTVTICRDPKDDMILDLALGGRATCVISGDEDLLVLSPFHGIPIVSPRAFLEEILPGLGR